MSFWDLLPSHDTIRADIVNAEVDLVQVNDDETVNPSDTALYTKDLNTFQASVREIETDCRAAGATITIKLNTRPTS